MDLAQYFPTSEDVTVKVLFDLMLHDNVALSTIATAILLREYSEKTYLCRAVRKAQLLQSHQDIKMYRECEALCGDLRLLSNVHMNDDAAFAIADTINRLLALLHVSISEQGSEEISSKNATTTADASQAPPSGEKEKERVILSAGGLVIAVAPKDACQENSHHMQLTWQLVIRNLNVLNNVLKVLLHDDKDLSEECLNSLEGAIMLFLLEFCKNNHAHQLLLFSHLDLILSRVRSNGANKACECVCEIIRNNRTIVVSLSEKDIGKFVNLITIHGHQPRFVELLRSLVLVRDRPIRRNQEIVFAALLTIKAPMLLNDVDGTAEAWKRLMSMPEALMAPSEDFLYHNAVLSLLNICAIGKVQTVEARCRALFPLSTCIDILLSKDVVPVAKTTYLHFLQDVYIDADEADSGASILESKAFWQLLDSMVRDVDAYCARTLPPMQFRPNLGSMSSPLLRLPPISKEGAGAGATSEAALPPDMSAGLLAGKNVLSDAQGRWTPAELMAEHRRQLERYLVEGVIPFVAKCLSNAGFPPDASLTKEQSAIKAHCIASTAYFRRHSGSTISDLDLLARFHQLLSALPPISVSDFVSRDVESSTLPCHHSHSGLSTSNVPSTLSAYTVSDFAKDMRRAVHVNDEFDELVERLRTLIHKAAQQADGESDKEQKRLLRNALAGARVYPTNGKTNSANASKATSPRSATGSKDNTKDKEKEAPSRRESVYCWEVEDRIETDPLSVVRVLIAQLRTNLPDIHGVDHQEHREAILRLLHSLVTRPHKDAAEEDPGQDVAHAEYDTDAQKAVVQCGGVEAVVRLIGSYEGAPQSSSGAVLRGAVNLAIALLSGVKGGNRPVQDAFMHALRTTKGNVMRVLRELVGREMAKLYERKQQSRTEAMFASGSTAGISLHGAGAGGGAGPEEVGSDVALEEADSRREDAYMRSVLRFVQLLCEGRNRDAQDWVTYQSGKNTTVDLLAVLLQFSRELAKNISTSATTRLAAQLFATIHETIIGPHCQNQKVVVRHLSWDSINAILFLHRRQQQERRQLRSKQTKTATAATTTKLAAPVPAHAPLLTEVSSQEVEALQQSVGRLLLGILEGHSDHAVYSAMARELSVLRVLQEIESIHAFAKHNNNDSRINNKLPAAPMPMGPSKSGEPVRDCLLHDTDLDERLYRREMLDSGMVLYMVLRTLYDSGHASDTLLSYMMEKERGMEYMQFYGAWMGRIELVLSDSLQRIYFPIPELTCYFPLSSKKNFIWNLDRESPQSRVRDLFEKAPEIELEMKLNRSIRIRRGIMGFILRQTLNNYRLLLNVSFTVALIQNLINVMPSPPNDTAIYQVIDGGTRALGMFQVFLATLILLAYVAQHSKLVLVRGFKAMHQERYLGSKDKVWVDKGEHSYKAIPRDTRFYAYSLYFMLQRPVFLYYIGYLVFALAGTITGFNSFFAYHVLDFAVRSRLLQTVLHTVASNIRSISVVLIFGVILVYIFVTFAYQFFGEDMVGNSGPYCQSLGQCLFFGLLTGFHDGQVLPADAVLTDGRYWNDAGGKDWILFILLTSNYVVIGLILTNVILSIIMDSFAAKREETRNITDDIMGRCTVCNLERSTFDRQGNGFSHHVQHDHNIWMYIYYTVYLETTSPDDYSGIDLVIAEKISKKQWDFVPTNRALVLIDHTDDKDAEDDTKELKRKITELQSEVRRLSEGMNKLGNSMQAAQPSQTLPS